MTPVLPAFPRSTWKSRLRAVALVLAALACLWLTAVFFLQRSLVFPGQRLTGDPEPQGFPPLERGHLSTPDGWVERWFIPGRDRTSDSPGPAVLFAHGNANLIDHEQSLARGYFERGISLLLVEFPGYGRSPGSPSEEAIVSDFELAYDWLQNRPEVAQGEIIFHGYSIGTGVVAALSRRRVPAALVLQAPFRSLRAMAAGYGVPGFLVRDPFESERHLRHFAGPILVYHGTHDPLIPVQHGRALADRRGATYVELPVGHGPFPTDSEEFWRPLESLLRTRGLRANGRASKPSN